MHRVLVRPTIRTLLAALALAHVLSSASHPKNNCKVPASAVVQRHCPCMHAHAMCAVSAAHAARRSSLLGVISVSTADCRGITDSVLRSTGWITHWHDAMANTSAAELAGSLQALLAMPASVNLYVAHGGTNFGFSAGGAISQHDVCKQDHAMLLSQQRLTQVSGRTQLRCILAVVMSELTVKRPELHELTSGMTPSRCTRDAASSRRHQSRVAQPGGPAG